jgi:hypothetical protein
MRIWFSFPHPRDQAGISFSTAELNCKRRFQPSAIRASGMEELKRPHEHIAVCEWHRDVYPATR